MNEDILWAPSVALISRIHWNDEGRRSSPYGLVVGEFIAVMMMDRSAILPSPSPSLRRHLFLATLSMLFGKESRRISKSLGLSLELAMVRNVEVKINIKGDRWCKRCWITAKNLLGPEIKAVVKMKEL